MADSPIRPRLIPEIHRVARAIRLSPRTEQAYIGWTKRLVRWAGMRHPTELTEPEIVGFLEGLVTRHHVAPTTQTQARAAILFLYQRVLGRDLSLPSHIAHIREPRRAPVVLSRDEVRDLLGQLDGVSWLIAVLLYGSGLRLMECLQLRVKDVDLQLGELTVRSGKGDKDRVTPLPAVARPLLGPHLTRVAMLHRRDCHAGFGDVPLPAALARKYKNAGRDLRWQ